MSPLHVLWARRRVVAVEIRVSGAVDGVFPVDQAAEAGREFLICGVARGLERVAADGQDGVVVEVRYAGGLVLVHEVGVPSGGAAGFAEAGGRFGGLERGPDDGYAGDAGDLWGLWLVGGG